MNSQRLLSGTYVQYSEGYTLVDSSVPADSTRSAAGTPLPGAESVDVQALLVALSDAGLRTEERIELASAGGVEVRKPSRRGAPAESTGYGVVLDVAVAPGESAAVLVEEDGYLSWAFPLSPQPSAGVRSARGALTVEPGTLRFEVELGGQPSDERTRSVGTWVRKQIADRVVARVLRFAARIAVGQAMTLLERNVRRGMVVISGARVTGDPAPSLFDPARWPLVQDLSSYAHAGGGTPRILLLVHGTFSNTAGSFGALAVTEWGKALLADAAREYDLILGFDHPTLSVDPLQNAVELERFLKTLGLEAAVIDAVAYSRGGLVLRSLVEVLRFTPRLRMAAFVAATNGGTRLAEPENWRALIDLYTNLVVGASRFLSFVAPQTAGVSAVASELAQGLGAFAKYLATEAVTHGGIPGLAAMEPDGAFVTNLSLAQPGQPAPGEIEYYAVTSEFEATLGGPAQLPARLLQMLADRFVDRLMDSANDLVVDTPSMTAIDPAISGLVREVCELGTNRRVYHTIYFAQPEVCDALRRWLKLPAEAETGVRGAPRLQMPDEWVPIRPKYQTPQAPASPAPVREAVSRLALEVEVVWGDIREIGGEAENEVFAVGHYQGVLPQEAEKALDERVSRAADAGHLVLTQLTRRGMLVGALGDIDFFPMSDGRGSLAVVCGMGHPGAFGDVELRQLHRNLTWTLNRLPATRTLTSVLIGSGKGTLSAEAAVRAMLAGFAEALGVGEETRIARVRIVEIFRHKAEEILGLLKEAEAAGESGLELRVASELVVGGGGRLSGYHRYALMIAAAARACVPGTPQEVLEPLLRLLPAGYEKAEYAQQIREALAALLDSDGADLTAFARRISLRVEAQEGRSGDAFPTRISFIRHAEFVRAAAITASATIPERPVDVDWKLVAEAVRRMSDPAVETLPSHSDLLLRLVVPQEFRGLLRGGGPLVLEVDRHTAAIHWEMLAGSTQEGSALPVGLSRPVARQIRTTYAAAPSAATRPRRTQHRALVIGDPGDPAGGYALRFALEEAIAVATLLHSRGIEVELMLGAAGRTDIPRTPLPWTPARRFDALDRLIRGDFDIVHYAGHASYDLKDPGGTGWMFSDGLLRAAEIRRIDTAPTLVFANACLSGQLSRVVVGGRPSADHLYGDAGLLPSLADEFFNRGVRNYIGTAWEVDDRGAVEFARRFYGAFIRPAGAVPALSIGAALLRARQDLARRDASARCLWGAYQHYGDPTMCADEL